MMWSQWARPWRSDANGGVNEVKRVRGVRTCPCKGYEGEAGKTTARSRGSTREGKGRPPGSLRSWPGPDRADLDAEQSTRGRTPHETEAPRCARKRGVKGQRANQSRQSSAPNVTQARQRRMTRESKQQVRVRRHRAQVSQRKATRRKEQEAGPSRAVPGAKGEARGGIEGRSSNKQQQTASVMPRNENCCHKRKVTSPSLMWRRNRSQCYFQSTLIAQEMPKQL
eukprot:5147676-Amphidinium_carterae.6